MNLAKKLVSVDEFLHDERLERAQLIDGGVVVMPNTKPMHGRAQTCLAKVIGGQWDVDDEDPTKPGGWWITTEAMVRYGRATVFNHDLAGWRRERMSAFPSESKCFEMTPDWVCEILSTNVKDDKERKFNALRDWQVPHYWVVDPEGMQIRIWEHDGKDYQVLMDVDTLYKGTLPPFAGSEISVHKLFGIKEPTSLVQQTP